MHIVAAITVKVLDEHFLDSCFGEAVLAVHGDELAAYAL
jgi:hypothetical protein